MGCKFTLCTTIPLAGLMFNLTTLPSKGSLYNDGIGILQVPYAVTGKTLVYIPVRDAGNYTTSFQYIARVADSQLFSDSVVQTITISEPDFYPSPPSFYREFQISFGDNLKINLLEDICIQSSSAVINISTVPPFGKLFALSNHQLLSEGSIIEIENVMADAIVQYTPEVLIKIAF